jgi:hypothetical protein
MPVAPTASSPAAPATPLAVHAEAASAGPTATKPAPQARVAINAPLLVLIVIFDLHQHIQINAAPSVCLVHALPQQLVRLAIPTSLDPTA